MSKTERIFRENQRSEGYALLAACFHAPDRMQLLQDKTCLRLAATLDNLGLDSDAARAVFMHEQLAATSEMQLKVDHAALFAGPFELKAPPYGSVYLEEGRRLMGETTMKASSFYAGAGLQLTIHEPADHIAVELEFMHFLSFATYQAMIDDDLEKLTGLFDKQQRFLGEQLGTWVPDFCSAIRTGAETLYFKALADCLQAFTGADIHLLNEQLRAVS
jgi:putative dimethyl sulfoxide reductase chaperone